MSNRRQAPNDPRSLRRRNAELVRKYYSGLGMTEWRRLVRDPYHRLEFETTMHFLRKYLPKKGLILDAGGGPGRYTVELARLGYDVVLFDLTPQLLDIARRQIKKAKMQKRTKRIVQGSIDDLSVFEDETFDGVLATGGALSHVVDGFQRDKAIDELVRVAKKDSPIFISVMGRLALLVTEIVYFPNEIEIKEVFQSIRDTGDYHGGYGFAPCHFYLPEELESQLESKGLRVMETVGLEGLAAGHRKETNRLAKNKPKAWKIWWRTHLETCTHPASVGISEHFLVVSKK